MVKAQLDSFFSPNMVEVSKELGKENFLCEVN